jgi:hypothetical protein
MSYSRRQLYAMGEPIGDSATRREVGGKVVYGGGGSGGGGSTTTTSTGTQYTSSVPKWLESEQKEIVARGMALAQSPYTPYTGERISQFTPMQRQAFGAAEQQQTAPQLGMASGLAGLSGMQSFRQPGTAGSFMNPFLEQALAPQLAGVARESAIRGTQQQGEATMRGAFGGSRDAIMRAEREKNLMGQQSDILGRGYAQAFDSAQSQFNAERAAQMQAAGLLGQLGQQQFGQEMDIMGRQREFGDAQQQQIQRILDQQFSDFQAQRDFPYQQIGFASDLIQGRGGSTRSMYQQPTASPLQTAAGLGGIAAGLGGLLSKGGEVKHYANGGITGLLDDQQLAQAAQNPGQGPMMQLAAAEEAQQRDMIRSAAPSDMPRETDMTEQELLAALQQAIREGNQTKARVITELIEERKMPESGIAAIASDDIGDMPEGGLIGMAYGGEVTFQAGGSPYERTQEILRRQEEEAALAAEMENAGIMAGGGRGPIPGPTAEQMTAAHQANPRMMAGLPALKQEEQVAETPAEPGGVVTPQGYMQMMREAGYDPVQSRQDLMMRQEQLQQDRAEGVAADRASLDEMIAARGVYGKEQEERLKGELEGLTGRKETAKSMALFQAGLAILSADPSRGALAAIGEGALKGVGAYKGDLEKLESQREKINERTDRILDIRRQESVVDDKERLALQKEENRLKQLNSQEAFEMYKGFGIEDRTLATAVTDQVIRTREAQLTREARRNDELAMQRMGLNALNSRRILLQGQLKAAQTAFDEAEIARINAELTALDRELQTRGGMGSAGGTGGGTLSSADQDLINKYR